METLATIEWMNTRIIKILHYPRKKLLPVAKNEKKNILEIEYQITQTRLKIPFNYSFDIIESKLTIQ